jgi:hydrogenase expression/formation protein HypC
MCLAVPAKVESLLEEEKAVVDLGGVRQTVSVALLPEAKPGDYVVVHVGFALSVLDEEEARQSLAMLEALPPEESPLLPEVSPPEEGP